MRQIRASHVVVIEIVIYQGQPVPYDNREARDAIAAIEGEAFVIRGGGLQESIPLADVQRVEMYPGGKRFGLMAATRIVNPVGGMPEEGTVMVRIDAKTFGQPTKRDLNAFASAVRQAAQRAR